MTSIPYKEEDVIVLHQHLMDPEKFQTEHKAEMKRIAEEKKKKKDKKKKKGGEDSEEGEQQGPKRQKVDPSSVIAEKSKSEVYAGLFVPKQDKNKVTNAEDLMMLAPGSKNGYAGNI